MSPRRRRPVRLRRDRLNPAELAELRFRCRMPGGFEDDEEREEHYHLHREQVLARWNAGKGAPPWSALTWETDLDFGAAAVAYYRTKAERHRGWPAVADEFGLLCGAPGDAHRARQLERQALGVRL